MNVSGSIKNQNPNTTDDGDIIDSSSPWGKNIAEKYNKFFSPNTSMISWGGNDDAWRKEKGDPQKQSQSPCDNKNDYEKWGISSSIGNKQYEQW